MLVTLTNDPADLGKRPVSSHQDCACDCQCACPTDGASIPVLSLPVAYYLELTPACTNRCPGCGNVYAAGRASLSAPLDGEEWCGLIGQLAATASRFKLTGGEAPLHPAFTAIVHRIEDWGVPFTLFTNGRWPDPGPLITLLRTTATCEGLLVSLHGPDAATHEAFTAVPGSFDETVANVRRAAGAGLDVATSMVVHSRNWDRIEETLELSLRLGANHLVCNRFIGAPSTRVAPSQAQLRAAVTTIESLCAAGRPVRFGNCIPQCFVASSSRGCTAGSTFATIDPWARLRPCNHAPLLAGDLRTQSLEEVWLGGTMAGWRALLPAGCSACPAFAICHGGCRAQALLAGSVRDPLMRGSLADGSAPSPGVALPLYAGLRPLGRFSRRRESGSELLLYRDLVISIPAGLEEVISRLDGSLTLQQIEHQYGHAAVDWVGTLHQEGAVTWAALR